MSSAIITIIGNLGRPPELRYTPQGKAVCDYSVAVSTRKKDKGGEWQEVTSWFKITSWDKQAENDSKYLDKGKKVAVTGRFSTEDWTDRDGATRTTLLIQPMHIEYLEKLAANDGNDFSQNHRRDEFTAEEKSAGLGGW